MNLFFGCSHVLGTELDQELEINSSTQDKEAYIESNRFAKILSDKMGLDHEIFAEIGADNSWIAYKVIEVIENINSSINNAIVCWSGPTRVQKIINGGTFFVNPLYPGHAGQYLKKEIPNSSKEIDIWEKVEHDIFLDNDFCNKQLQHFARYVKLYLDSKNINCIFLKSVESDVNLLELNSSSVNLSFHEFYTENKYKVGVGGHALSEGHREWANYIYNNI